MSLKNWLGRFRRDEGGATAVEFALLAAPFFGCIGIVLLMGYMFIVATSLEDSVNEAGRHIRVGKVAAANMTRNGFREFICDRLVLRKATCLADLVIHVESSPTAPGLPNTSPHTGGALDPGRSRYNPGDSSEYVMVQAYLPYSSMHSLFSLLGGTTMDNFTISSATVFRNEPF